MIGLRHILTACITIILSFSFANAAAGACDTRDKVLANLKEAYNESVVGRGISQEGKRMVELLASPEGTWTVVVSYTNNWACTAQAGVGWINVQVESGPGL